MSATKVAKTKVSKKSKAARSKIDRAAISAPATAKPQSKKRASEKPKKLSALDAAANVLTETGQSMSTRELIETMAAKGYWTSPGGATPAATLYSAILREIGVKGKEARFIKTERGRFGLRK
jgi:hypothetical protein